MRNIARRIGTAASFIAVTAAAGCGAGGASPPRQTDLSIAYAEIDQGRPDAAIARADAVLARGDTSTSWHADALYIRGRALEAKAAQAGQQGQTAIAKQHLIWAGDAYVRSIQKATSPVLQGLARAGWANVAFFLDDFPVAAREWTVAVPLTKDPGARAWMIYRVGLSRQRMGWFEGADRAFEQVVREYPQDAGGDPARRAQAAMGARAFYVRAATFTSAAAADREVRELKKQGVSAVRFDDTAGRSVVRVGPIPTFADARVIQSRVAGRHRDATIEP